MERAAVHEMYRLIRPGGYVLVNVAAMEIAARRPLGAEPRSPALQPRRLSARLLTGAGFTVVRLTYTNASLFLPMVAVRAVQRMARPRRRRSDAQQDITVPPAPVNALLTAALRVESWWLRVFDSPFGSSLLCLARKPA